MSLERRIRMCAFPALWLKKPDGIETSKTITWSTGSTTKQGDLQIFCISTIVKKSGIPKTDPRVDAVHSIWEATSDCFPVPKNSIWPLQAEFRLLIKLDNPVRKAELFKQSILKKARRGGWPRGSKGKLLNGNQVINLTRLLLKHNPLQRERISGILSHYRLTKT